MASGAGSTHHVIIPIPIQTFIYENDLLFPAYGYGVDQCSWGPSHWCSSLKNAKNCGAVQHCIGTVWSNSEPSSVSEKMLPLCCKMYNIPVHRFTHLIVFI